MDSAQRARYDSLYRRFIEQTQPDRDSMAAARERAVAGMGNRDMPNRGQGRGAMQAIVNRLAGQQKAFDDLLHKFLRKDQWKRYQKWRAEKRKAAEAEQRERVGGRGGWPPG